MNLSTSSQPRNPAPRPLGLRYVRLAPADVVTLGDQLGPDGREWFVRVMLAFAGDLPSANEIVARALPTWIQRFGHAPQTDRQEVRT